MATPRLDRVESRARLKPRRDPHWNRLAAGRYLGFRRMATSTPGVWLARAYRDKKYQYKSLGDFAGEEEGKRYDAAKKDAEEWFAHLDLGGSTKRVTVEEACLAYVRELDLAHQPIGTKEDAQDMVSGIEYKPKSAPAVDAHGRFKRLVFEDDIASVDLTKLRSGDVADWKLRVKASAKSESAFYRNLTAMRAALNLALKRKNVASALAWAEELKRPKGSKDPSRTLYLDRSHRRALIDFASDEVRPLLTGLCLLPLRPGELVGCKVADFDAPQGMLRVAGKTGARSVPLSKDAITFFKEQSKSKLPAAWLVCRADGKQWNRYDWRDQVKLAAAAARLPAATTLYTLRHSTITDLVTGGLDLFTVAEVSGTSVKMIQDHYGKLRAQVARKALNRLSL